MIDYLWIFFKYLMIVGILMLCYAVYRIIIWPFMNRRKYRQFHNVFIDDDIPETGTQSLFKNL